MHRLITIVRNQLFSIKLQSIQTKIFFLCLIIALSVMALSLQVVYRSASKVVEENAYNYIYESMKYAESNLNIMVQDAMNISLAIATNSDIILENILSNSQAATYQEFREKRLVQNYLSSFMTNKSYINMAAVITTDGRCFQSSGTMLLKDVINESWFKSSIGNSSVQIFYNSPGDKQIFVCRPIKYNRKVIALIIIELNYEILKKVYNVAPLEQAQILTLTSAGNVVFTNSEKNEIINIANTPLEKSIKEYKPEKRYYIIDDEKKLMVLYHSSINQLTTVGTISYDKLITEALSIRNIMFIILIICLVLAVVFSWYFSRFLCRNIQSLKNNMNEIRSGDLNVRASIISQDEIGDMALHFNHMMDDIQGLMTEIKQKEKQKREAEYMALQSQIQPHFIYNAINSIKYVAHMRNETEIEQVSIALVQLLRSVLGNTSEFIPLWKECEYIKDYICIQQFKARTEYSVVWDVEEDLWDIPLPKLLLQPIVENAIIHGIAHKKDGRVEIQVFSQGGQIHFKITDNGKGMEQEEIDFLLQGENEKTHFRNVGISNVFGRIQSIYGDGYGGEITSFPGAFTCIELRIPLTGKEEISHVKDSNS